MCTHTQTQTQTLTHKPFWLKPCWLKCKDGFIGPFFGPSPSKPLPNTHKTQQTLEKTLNSSVHATALEKSSLAPEVVKGSAYKKLLKNTEKDIKKLMGW